MLDLSANVVHIEYLPTYNYKEWGALSKGSSLSAGYDLRAAINSPIQLMPHQRKLIPLGIKTSLPSNVEAQVRARSGLALKKGIGLVNGIGTIDADYRGEWGAILYNYSDETFDINPGDRVAQVVFSKLHDVILVRDSVNDTTDREGGFGSTGVA